MQTHNVMLAANCLPGEYHTCVYCMIFYFYHGSFLLSSLHNYGEGDVGLLPGQSKGWLSAEYSPPARYFVHVGWKKGAGEGNFVQLLDAEMLHVW